MHLLLDTHGLIWTLRNDPTIGTQAREAIGDPDNEVFVSVVSVWEISIKRAMGRLDVPADIVERIRNADFVPLPADFDHAELAGRLPLHHRDPFDRMLVAQAQVENLILVTRDRNILRYEVETLTA